MSQIEVDKVIPQSGTDVQLGDSGDTITIPAGATITNNGTANGFGSADTEKVKVSSNDTTAGFLNGKLVGGANITLTEGSDGGDETLTAALSGTIPTARLGSGTADATTFLRGDQTFASATPAANSITTSQLAYNPNPFRNIIINGDMSIAQRGTSTSSVTTTDGYYACDRWRSQTDTGTWTISQSTDVPTGQGFVNSFKLDCTSAGTSNDDEVGIRHLVEGQNVQYLKYGTSSAESTTLSFWIKTNKTGNYSVALKNVNSTQERLVSFTYAVSSADTWEKKTITFPGDTSQALDNSNASDLEIYWYFGAASGFRGGVVNTWTNYSASNFAPSDLAGLGGSTNDEVYITGVQLEAGQTASEFEFLPHDVNLRRCQRYYQFIAAGNNFSAIGGEFDTPICNASSYNSASAYGVLDFTTTMRSAPSLDQVTGDSYYRYYNNNNSTDFFDSFNLASATSTKRALFNNVDAISISSGQAGWFATVNNASYVALNSEL